MTDNAMQKDKQTKIRRRTFLITGAVGTLALGLGLWHLKKSDDTATRSTSPGLPSYGDWRDLYREKWRWDRIAVGSHTNANCVSACAWNLYVRDGIVWREEQSAPYSAPNATVPDANPRGCQKGSCYSSLSTGANRISVPLKRAGPRGGDQWKRISWDEALDEVAGSLVDTLAKRGGPGAICEAGTNQDFGPTFVSLARFFRQTGIPLTDTTAGVGDLAVGGTITLGEAMSGGSSDGWFQSKYLVLWAFNPSATRIPDAHYINEARYQGAKVISIAPDFNQSAMHTDLWMPVKPGSDAALALAACQVVIEENLHNTDYIREQTDLPFLIYTHSGRFVRQSDFKTDGSDEIFAVWDEIHDKMIWAPGSSGSDDNTLTLPNGIRAALEIETVATLVSGEQAAITTVFSRLRKRLAENTPEQAQEITGVEASVIRQFARDFANAPTALILSQYGMCKNYHSDLVQRSQILLASLTGNIGKSGGGWQSTAFIPLDGFALMAMQDKLAISDLIMLGIEQYQNPEEVADRFKGMYIGSTLFHAIHGGLAEQQTKAQYGDPLLEDGAMPYLREAIEKGHFKIGTPIDEAPPEFIFNIMGNVLRSSRMGDRLRDGLFANASMVVDVTFRMSETSRHCDIILPAAGWYEKYGFKYIPANIPYVHLSDRAIKPIGESKAEWEIFSLLAKRVSDVAKRRGVNEIKGFRGDTLDLQTLYERFSDEGRFADQDDEKVMEFILQISQQSKGMSLDDLRRAGGALRVKALGSGEGMRCDYDPEQTITPQRDYLEKKKPYPTLTGRQQFYIDHPLFLKLNEALPTYKEPPAAGGNHPFTMTGGHTRWSIHAIWRDHELMLRLQRGEPILFINDQDALEKKIKDHDLVRVRNDLGSFEAPAKITAAIRPKQIHIFHAWEPYQFRKKKSHQSIIPSPIKVTQLVGDYGHLHGGFSHYEPNQVDRDTRVDVVKVLEV